MGELFFIKKGKKTKTRSSLGRRVITNLFVKRLTTGQPGVARNPPAGVGAKRRVAVGNHRRRPGGCPTILGLPEAEAEPLTPKPAKSATCLREEGEVLGKQPASLRAREEAAERPRCGAPGTRRPSGTSPVPGPRPRSGGRG